MRRDFEKTDDELGRVELYQREAEGSWQPYRQPKPPGSVQSPMSGIKKNSYSDPFAAYQTQIQNILSGRAISPVEQAYRQQLQQLAGGQVAAGRGGGPGTAAMGGQQTQGGLTSLASAAAPVGTGLAAEQRRKYQQILDSLGFTQSMDEAQRANAMALAKAQQADFEKQLAFAANRAEVERALGFYGSLPDTVGGVVGMFS